MESESEEEAADADGETRAAADGELRARMAAQAKQVVRLEGVVAGQSQRIGQVRGSRAGRGRGQGVQAECAADGRQADAIPVATPPAHPIATTAGG